MTRMLISLQENDRSWLEQKSKESGVPMSEVVRQAIRQAQKSGRRPFRDILAATKGLWRQGDGLKYQRRIRKEWR